MTVTKNLTRAEQQKLNSSIEFFILMTEQQLNEGSAYDSGLKEILDGLIKKLRPDLDSITPLKSGWAW